MISSTLNKLGNILTLDDIKTKANIDPVYKHLISIIDSPTKSNKTIQSYLTFEMLETNYQHLME